MSKATNKYSPEVRERAVRLVLDNQGQHESGWSAIHELRRLSDSNHCSEALTAQPLLGDYSCFVSRSVKRLLTYAATHTNGRFLCCAATLNLSLM